MVIDVHVHPTGYSLISQDPEEREFRTRVFQKKVEQDHSPIAMTGKPSGGNSFDHGSEEVTFTQMDSFGIDRLVLLPLDLTTTHGGWIVSNDQIKQLVDFAPDFSLSALPVWTLAVPTRWRCWITLSRIRSCPA